MIRRSASPSPAGRGLLPVLCIGLLAGALVSCGGGGGGGTGLFFAGSPGGGQSPGGGTVDPGGGTPPGEPQTPTPAALKLQVLSSRADLVSGGEDDFTNFQAKAVGDEDLRRMGYTDDSAPEDRDEKAEQALEIGLEGTFPASDPV